MVIGNGTPEQARAFRDERGLRMPLYVDPRLRAYRAAGLRNKMAISQSLKVLGNAVRAMKEGHFQGATQGDPWQLGGVFVLAPGGQVRYEQRSAVAGDHADPAAILAALGSPSTP